MSGLTNSQKLKRTVLDAATRPCIERMESRTLLTAAGDLDLSFSGDGKATVDFGGTQDLEGRVAVDSQGRIVVAGYSSQGGSTGVDFAVARFNPNGTLDTTFDGDGRATVDFAGGTDNCYSVAVDSQGRILLGGSSRQSTISDFAVARLNADGSLDTTFDGDGKVTIGFNSNEDFGFSVAVDSLDRVVVGGQSFQPVTANDFVVARLLASDGSLDPGFDGDGRAIISFGTPDERAYSVAVDSLNRVVIAGFSNQGGVRGYDFTAARLNANGSLDASFDGDGRAAIDFDDNDTGYSVAVDSLDRVVLGGFTDLGAGTGYDLAVARLIDGALDPSFDGDGKATVDFFGADESQGAVAVDSLDRILLSGTTSGGGTSADFAVARFNAGGGLDTSFSTDGKATVDFGNTADNGTSVAVDSLDRVVVRGHSVQSGNFDFAVVRLLGVGNTAPVAHADSYTVAEDGSLNANDADGSSGGPNDDGVLANDNDVDLDALSAVRVGTNVSFGTLTFNSDGSFTYIPFEGFVGTDSFRYRASDGQAFSGIVTVTIEVTELPTGVTGGTADPCGDGTATRVVGTAGDDQIQVSKVGNTGAYEISLNGTTFGPFTDNKIIIKARGGDDNVQVTGSLSRPVWAYGEGGDDRLKGGNGHDVLLGGADEDLIVGGSGRDLLIGGEGADRMVGNDEDDILIAGTTDHDADPEGLCGIMDEWTSSGTYAARVSNLQVSLLNSSTVFDDMAADILTGSAGMDWFIFDGANDRITDLHSGEYTSDDLAFIGA